MIGCRRWLARRLTSDGSLQPERASERPPPHLGERLLSSDGEAARYDRRGRNADRNTEAFRGFAADQKLDQIGSRPVKPLVEPRQLAWTRPIVNF